MSFIATVRPVEQWTALNLVAIVVVALLVLALAWLLARR
jgi:hypothetical protein